MNALVIGYILRSVWKYQYFHRNLPNYEIRTKREAAAEWHELPSLCHHCCTLVRWHHGRYPYWSMIIFLPSKVGQDHEALRQQTPERSSVSKLSISIVGITFLCWTPTGVDSWTKCIVARNKSIQERRRDLLPWLRIIWSRRQEIEHFEYCMNTS